MPAPPTADALRRARNGIGLGRHRRKTTAAREVVRWINEELSCSSTKIRIYRQGLKCGLSFACISREVFTITGQKAPIFPPTPDCAHEKVGSFRAKVHDFSAKQGHFLRKVALFFDLWRLCSRQCLGRQTETAQNKRRNEAIQLKSSVSSKEVGKRQYAYRLFCHLNKAHPIIYL